MTSPSGLDYFTDALGERVAYEHAGSAGPAVIFLHGFGASRESWNELRDLLMPHMQLYLVDLKGFGLSAKPANTDYSMRGQAGMIGHFVESHGLRDVTLVGHSYGGGVALLTLFADHARRVRRLVLVDAAGYAQPLPYFVAILPQDS